MDGRLSICVEEGSIPFGGASRPRPQRGSFITQTRQPMHQRTLLLTPWYFPQRILRWQDAITMVFLSKVDVVVEYDEMVRSPSYSMKLPAVIRSRSASRVLKRGV